MTLIPIMKHGTVVIVRKTADAIYAGADTQLTSDSYDPITGKIITTHESFCKIATLGNFNCAVIGGSITENLEIASSACNQNNSFKDVLKIYVKSFQEIVQKRIGEIRSWMPVSEYKAYIEKRLTGYYSQCIFFGIDGDSLFSKNILCSIQDPFSKPVTLQWSISEVPTLFGGNILNIKERVLDENTWKGDPIEIIENLIKIASKQEPNDVNEKVDLVKITKDKTVWIKKN